MRPTWRNCTAKPDGTAVDHLALLVGVLPVAPADALGLLALAEAVGPLGLHALPEAVVYLRVRSRSCIFPRQREISHTRIFTKYV